jgi:hypothetical protein
VAFSIRKKTDITLLGISTVLISIYLALPPKLFFVGVTTIKHTDENSFGQIKDNKWIIIWPFKIVVKNKSLKSGKVASVEIFPLTFPATTIKHKIIHLDQKTIAPFSVDTLICYLYLETSDTLTRGPSVAYVLKLHDEEKAVIENFEKKPGQEEGGGYIIYPLN